MINKKNRFLYNLDLGKNIKWVTPVDYYNGVDEEDDISVDDIKKKIVPIDKKEEHKNLELEQDYFDAFDEIIDGDEKLQFCQFVGSIKFIDNLIKKVYAKYETSEPDFYYHNIIERLEKAKELLNEGYKVDIWFEPINIDDELLIGDVVDILFFVDRRRVDEFIRDDFTINNVKSKVLDYNKIDEVKSIMLKSDIDDFYIKDITIVSLLNIDYRELNNYENVCLDEECDKKVELVKYYLPKYKNKTRYDDELIDSIEHQEYDFLDYAMLVCTPLSNKNVSAYSKDISLKGTYVSLYDFYNVKIRKDITFFIFVEYSGAEVDDYLAKVKEDKTKFCNNEIYIDDLKKNKSLDLYFKENQVYIVPNDRKLAESDYGEKLKYDLNMYSFCGTKYGYVSIKVEATKNCKVEDIEEFFMENNDNDKYYQKFIEKFFDKKTDNINIEVKGSIVNADDLFVYYREEDELNREEYFSFYANSIMLELNRKLSDKLLDQMNTTKKNTKSSDISSFLMNLEAEYAIVSLMNNKVNYQNLIDITKLERLNEECGEKKLETLFESGLKQYRELADFKSKSQNNNITLIFSTVTTANTIMSFLSLYIAIVQQTLNSEMTLYLICIIVIQIICVSIAMYINFRGVEN